MSADLEDRFPDLEDRFAGSLLGLALGDALGAPHEGGVAGQAVWWLLGGAFPPRSPQGDGFGKRDLLRWTDDTEMAMVLAESLIEKRGLDADHLARAWAERADWRRGYGPGTRKLLGIVRGGTHWREASRAVFPEGSYGNGAAMRAAPLGLFFHRDPAELCRAAELASSITHAHPLGIEGGLLIARATAMALGGSLDLDLLREGQRSEEFRNLLSVAREDLDREGVRRRLGAGVEAHRSAVTAVHLAARFREFTPLLEFIISLGGDTDTIGAMAGGIFGARHGTKALPGDALERLEKRDWIEKTARSLYSVAMGR